MSFENLHLDEGENVILEVRKHWIIFAQFTLALFLSALLPLIVIYLLNIFYPTFFNYDAPGNGVALFSFFYVLWVLSLWLLFFVDWTKYYLDVWYVTEKRIIIVNQKQIFDREISNLRFDKIQDITVDVHGFIPTMLDFGNVRVQTASEDNREFHIRTVRHPENIRKVIFSRQNKINEGDTKVIT